MPEYGGGYGSLDIPVYDYTWSEWKERYWIEGRPFGFYDPWDMSIHVLHDYKGARKDKKHGRLFRQCHLDSDAYHVSHEYVHALQHTVSMSKGIYDKILPLGINAPRDEVVRITYSRDKWLLEDEACWLAGNLEAIIELEASLMKRPEVQEVVRQYWSERDRVELHGYKTIA